MNPTRRHCVAISKASPVRVAQAQSTTQIKLTGISQMIEIILLAQRQAPFKTFFPPGGVDDTGDGGAGTPAP